MLDLIAPMPTVRNLKRLDFGGRSLLNRNSELDYRFAHYSIQEFLVVQALLTDTLSADIANCQTNSQAKPRATAQMIEFFVSSGRSAKALSHFFAAYDCSDIRSGSIIFKDKMPDGKPGPEMVFIAAGDFMMGSCHPVNISKSFSIGRYPVTFAEFDNFCRVTGRQLPDDKGWGRGQRPVINISWEDASAYCVWLSTQCGVRYRLPCEAEWEYACRAGTTTDYFWGGMSENVAEFAWFNGNSKGKTHPVGEKQANPWGLYDMSGNVWEWVQDSWHEDLTGLPSDGTAWESAYSTLRVVRGGSWFDFADFLRSGVRYRYNPDYRSGDIGFRLAQD